MAHPDKAQKNRETRMAEIDRLSPELRQLVHDYGWTVVRAFLDCGVKKPQRIRHLVECVLDEFSPTRGSRAAQGPRTVIADPDPSTKTSLCLGG